MGDELLHAGGRTARHDEANSQFRNFAKAPKSCLRYILQNRLTFELLATLSVTSLLSTSPVGYSSLKTDVVDCTEMLVRISQTTLCHILEDRNLPIKNYATSE
jgi:hypothetical protein